MNWIRVLRNLLISNMEFVRLFRICQKIYFYDKHNRKIFYVFAPRKIDSITADHVFSNSSYSLKGLNIYRDLILTYDQIITKAQTPLILDLGSNIGLAAKYFNLWFPAAKIICIEPDIQNNNIAKKNCGSEIEINLGAIGQTEGFCKIRNPSADENAYQIELDASSDIPIITIDKILKDNPNCIPFICKIDIEGSEHELFASNPLWVKDFPLIIVEPHDWLFPKQAISRNLLLSISSNQFDLMIKGENLFLYKI